MMVASFEPTHIVIGPLNRNTVSIAANLAIEIIRNKHMYDMLQLSVISPYADDKITVVNAKGPPSMNARPASTSLKPSTPTHPITPEFDVVHATIVELRNIGVPVISSLTHIAPPPLDDLSVDRFTVPAHVSWFVHLDALQPIHEIQKLVRTHRVNSNMKVCYLRPSELDLGDLPSFLQPHEVVIRFGVLAEDLPFLPLDAPGFDAASPIIAATSALFPHHTQSYTKRRITDARKSNSYQPLNSSPLNASIYNIDTTASLPCIQQTLSPKLSPKPVQSSSPQPCPLNTKLTSVVYPLPFSCVMSFIINVTSSRFIYQQVYLICGAALHLPDLHALGMANQVTPPRTPSMHDQFPPSPNDKWGTTSTPQDTFLTSSQSGLSQLDPELHATPPTMFDEMDFDHLESHLQMIHDNVHSNQGVHLASLRTPSGRSLADISSAFMQGRFSIPSSDYARVLHANPPEFIFINDLQAPDSFGPIDTSLWSDAEHYFMGGGRFTVAVRDPPNLYDSA